ncbi:MAG: DUF839 domain-containing protein, partial [Acidobacteria bacterium]|nr:DUF839 domain-containing protein [Acidobacteriota bacterium]
MDPKEEVYSDQDIHDEDFCNNSNNESFEEVMARRFARRSFLTGAAATAGMLVINPASLAEGIQDGTPQPLTFLPIQGVDTDGVSVPSGYSAHVLIRWGDPLFPGVPSFDPDRQTPQAQSQQFGYNCDFVGFFPFPKSFRELPERRVSRGLLVVNHEYTDALMMFRNFVSGQPTREQVDIEIAAHGLTVVEIEYGLRSIIPRV